MPEVALTMSPGRDFRFDMLPPLYGSAPSSPKPFGNPDYYYHHASAPTSPTRAAAIYNHFSDSPEGFAFSRGALAEADLTPADQLFEAGKIRPLKPPLLEERGGRERLAPSGSISRSRRAARSLSPMRGGEGMSYSSLAPPSSATNSYSDASKDAGGSKRWRLRDLLLFRSASEGRATQTGSKDPLGKYYSILSPSSKGSRGGAPPASAHEMHYKANRAAAEEMKKKTPLAYHRVGLFGSMFGRS